MGCDEDGILSVERLRAEYEGDVIMYRVIDSIPTSAAGKIRYSCHLYFSGFCLSALLLLEMRKTSSSCRLFDLYIMLIPAKFQFHGLLPHPVYMADDDDGGTVADPVPDPEQRRSPDRGDRD